MTAINRTDSSHDNTSINQHPQYKMMMQTTGTDESGSSRIDFGRGIWDEMLDCYAGERQVKSRTTDYLPMTPGMALDTVGGSASYRNYLYRACFPECLSQTVSDMQGLLFAAPVNVELPNVLESMVDNCTIDGLDIDTLARQVTAAQLTTGRIGLLLDPQDGNGVIAPKIAIYNEKAIINWGEDENKNLIWVILNESGYKNCSATGIYQYENKYRVLALEQYEDQETGNTIYGSYYTYVTENAGNLDLTTPPANAIYPSIAGNVVSFIPFQIINSTDLSNDCSIPLLMSIANLSLAIYRNSADYELALFMTAQPTTVVIGAQSGSDIKLGANCVMSIPSTDASVHWHEISGNGITLQREAMRDKRSDIDAFGVKLSESGTESGTALNTRLTIKTASLTSVALTCEAGIKSILKMAAEWCGYNPDEVIFDMNKDFRNDQITTQDIALISAEIDKGRFRLQDLHKLLLDAQFTQEEDFDTWKAEVEESAASMPMISSLESYNVKGEESEQNEEDEVS